MTLLTSAPTIENVVNPQPSSSAEHYFATVAPEAHERSADHSGERPRPVLPPAEPVALVAEPRSKSVSKSASTDQVWAQLLKDDPSRRSSSRLLPPIVEPEPFLKRMLFVLVAACIAIGFLYLILVFWAPAHPGVDQNGYLVGGRMLADHGSTGYVPREPYSFVGAMWVGVKLNTAKPEYFPKYPIGLPALYAACLKLGPWYASIRPQLLALPVIRNLPLWVGQADGTTLAYLVSPICMMLAIWAMFLAGRLLAGSFSGIVAMILLATSQIVLGLANNPNSHASALCFVTWGVYFILKWWMTGKLWRGLLGGFLAGFAVTIRYTEGLLVLPIAVALLCSIRWYWPRWWLALLCIFTAGIAAAGLLAVHHGHSLDGPSLQFWSQNILIGVSVAALVLLVVFSSQVRSLVAPLLITFAWLIPVGILVWFNWTHIGHITGYDPTNESEGFTIQEFLHKWEFTAQQVYDNSVFFVLPLTAMGMTVMYRQSKRLGLFFTLWFVPILLLYTCYYWGANIRGLGFLRFFVTLFPAMILPAVWLIHSAGNGAKSTSGAIATPLAGGLLAVIAGAVGLYVALPGMARESAANLNLAYSGQRIISRITTDAKNMHGRPMMFCDQSSNWYQLAAYLQFAGDLEIYGGDAFRPPTGNDANGNQPGPLQPARKKYLDDNVFHNKKDSDLTREMHRVVQSALDEGRPVYAVLQPQWVPVFEKRYMVDGFVATQIDSWREPAAVPVETMDGALGPAGHGFVFNPGRAPQPYRMFRITHPQPTTLPAYSPFVSAEQP